MRLSLLFWCLFNFSFLLFYCRAPEIMLGLPYSYSLDMWGVGQILLSLFNPQWNPNLESYYNVNILHKNIYRQLELVLLVTQCVVCPQMKRLTHLLGPPPDHMLNDGLNTNRFFTEVLDSHESSWRLLVSTFHFDNGLIHHRQ